MTAFAHTLQAALLHFLWQGLVTAFLLWIALFILRKRSAQSRYLVSCAALGLMMAAPVVTAFLLYRAPAPPIAAQSVEGSQPWTLVEPAVTPESTASTWMVRLEPWALPLWSVGVLLFSLRLVWGCWRVAAMRRRGQPADAGLLGVIDELSRRMGLARPVRVLTASLPDGPSVVGWLRPVLLLPPATLLGLTPEQLEAVLAHELAHIRRYDHLVNAVQTLVETLLFYHPAVWWTSARIREERELCCDDLAVRACGDALCFARALTKLERLRVISPVGALGSTGGTLKFRVQRLIGVAQEECAPSKLSGILAFSLGLICLVGSVHWLRAQEPAPQRKQAYAIANITTDEPGVTVDLGGAAVLHRSRVEYPESALKGGIQGTVAVQLSLDASGNVADAHVVSGPMELRKTVMLSIFDWHFAQNAAGTTRIVNVNFQKAAAEADRKSGVPGALVVTDANPQSEYEKLKVELDAQNNRILVWNRASGTGEQAEYQGKVYTYTSSDGARREEAQALAAAQMDEAKARLQELERKAELANVSGDSAGANAEQISKQRAELNALQARQEFEYTNRVRENSERDRAAEQSRQPGGRTVAAIEAPGLSESGRNELLPRLPVHVGDTLTESSLKAMGEAIHSFDEHFMWRISVRNDGTAVIHIEVPRGAVIDK